jgi:hypothetical protein
MEIKKIIVKEKPFKCHICNFEPVSDLLYGVQIIDEQLQKYIDERKVLLGGCSLLDYSPKWLCSNCQTEYYLYKYDSFKDFM